MQQMMQLDYTAIELHVVRATWMRWLKKPETHMLTGLNSHRIENVICGNWCEYILSMPYKQKYVTVYVSMSVARIL